MPRARRGAWVRAVRGSSVVAAAVLAMILVVPSLVSIGGADAACLGYYAYPVVIGRQPPSVYLAHGPDYAKEDSLGRFYATQTGSPPNVVSGTFLYMNHTKASSEVLEINNTLSSTVRLWINGTLPTGVTLLFNNRVPWTSGATLNLNPGSPVLLIGFGVTNGASGSTDLYFTYGVAPGAFLLYTYVIYPNA